VTQSDAADGPVYSRAQEYIGRRVAEAIQGLDPGKVDRAVAILNAAPASFVYGAGRSGIIGRAFAMRLVQTGLTAYVIGESVTPIVRKGDAVFILSGAGESQSSVQTANIVRREGAELVVVTARATSKLAHAATLLLSFDFPDDAERRRLAPLGTLFESTSLLLTDALVAELMRVRHESEESMRRRHAIMV
jgi:6-phospho 3-hexuloisomerase